MIIKDCNKTIVEDLAFSQLLRQKIIRQKIIILTPSRNIGTKFVQKMSLMNS